jgi:hypothetical protein
MQGVDMFRLLLEVSSEMEMREDADEIGFFFLQYARVMNKDERDPKGMDYRGRL